MPACPADGCTGADAGVAASGGAVVAAGVAQFLLDIIPATFVDAFVHTEVLPVLFVYLDNA